MRFIWINTTSLLFYTTRWAVLLLLIIPGGMGCSILSEDATNDESKNNGPPGIGPPTGYSLIDREPAWSPDGATIAYVHSSKEYALGIYFVDSDGTNKRPFHTGPVGAPAWSPDGQWIAFHFNAQIYKKHVENDSLVQLTFEGRNFYPDWSPDGKYIAYNQSICNGPNTCGIWLMQSNGTEHRNLTTYGNHPAWEPKTNLLLYQTRAIDDEGKSIGNDFWIIDFDTGEKDLIIQLRGAKHYDNRYPKYSPDGSKIVFTSQPYGAPPVIFVMNTDDSNLQQITSKRGWAAAWSPDGQWIVYTESTETGRLWLMRPDGSEKQQVTFLSK